MAQLQWTSVCCNPFNKPGHSSKKRNLRPVLSWMCEKVPSLTLGAKICDDCRKKVASIPTPEAKSETREEACASSHSLYEEVYSPHLSLEPVNQCLSAIGETLIVKKKLQQVKYPKEKLKKISKAMKTKQLPERESSDSDESEMITQLKDKFENVTKGSDKVLVLTVLPKSWTIKKVQEKFGASNYMVRKAKELVKENGILSTPNPKPGLDLPAETTDLVQSFYVNVMK